MIIELDFNVIASGALGHEAISLLVGDRFATCARNDMK